MKRMALVGIVMTGALLAPSAASAQVSCTRQGLQRADDLYIAARTKGDVSGMPLAKGLGYLENMAPFDIEKGLIRTPLKPDLTRTFIDVATCQVASQLRLNPPIDPAWPRVCPCWKTPPPSPSSDTARSTPPPGCPPTVSPARCAQGHAGTSVSATCRKPLFLRSTTRKCLGWRVASSTRRRMQSIFPMQSAIAQNIRDAASPWRSRCGGRMEA